MVIKSRPFALIWGRGVHVHPVPPPLPGYGPVVKDSQPPCEGFPTSL